MLKVIMKILLTFFVLFFSSFVYAEIKYESETDEFTGTKKQSISDMSGESIKIEESLEKVKDKYLMIAYYADDTSKGGFVGVRNYYNDWNELGNDTAYVLLDGDQWNVHDFRLESDVDDGVSESYDFYYNEVDFKKILNSKEFAFKVGNFIAYIDLTKLPLSKFEF